MKRRALLAVIGVTAFTAAACSSPGATPGPTAPAIDRNATFRFADVLPIDGLDPVSAAGAGFNVWLFPVYDRLIHLTPNSELIPGLATKWEFSADGKQFKLTLRDNVKFTDGTPFDAAAVKANLDRAATDAKSTLKGEVANIASIEVVDKTHINLNLTGPDSSLPFRLTDRVGAMASPAAFANLVRQPVGTGMYKVTAFTPSTKATYERNPDYWDPQAVGFAKMEFTTITDSNQRLNALKTNSVDATLLEATDVAGAKAAGLTVDSKMVSQFFHLQLNLNRPYLKDVRVRQAINYAVNRDEIVKGLLFGLGESAVQPFPKGYSAYDETVGTSYYKYDPDKAKALLKEAGVPDGYTIELIVQNAPLYTKLSEALQAQLKAVGLNATITTTNSVANSFYVDAKGDASPINWTGRPDASQTISLLYTSKGFSNPGKVSTSEVDSLYAQLVTTTDAAKRTALTKELSAQITKDALDVVLYFPYSNLAYSKKVTGLQNYLSGKLEFSHVAMSA